MTNQTALRFQGRKSRRDGGGMFRTIHLTDATDPNRTICGQRLDYVREVGIVQVDVPNNWTYNDQCIRCNERGMLNRLRGK